MSEKCIANIWQHLPTCEKFAEHYQVSFRYAGALPLLYACAATTCFLMYWCDKFVLLHGSSVPPAELLAEWIEMVYFLKQSDFRHH